MKKLFDKKPLIFALLWIGIYVVSLSAADSASQMLGVEKLLTAPLCVCLTGGLWLWLRRHGMLTQFGLCPFRGKAKAYLYFIPLALLVSVNLWWGWEVRLSAAETALYILSMLCVGFLEELIFRGFLFKAMSRDNLKTAVIVSSLTFGFGHIVNLLSGSDLVPTLLQILYAAAAGFLFTVLFIKTGSLLPCIVTHSAINALSVFAHESGEILPQQLISGGFLFVVSVLYSIYCIRMDSGKEKV